MVYDWVLDDFMGLSRITYLWLYLHLLDLSPKRWCLLDLSGNKLGTCHRYHLLTFEEQVAFEDFRSLFQQLEQGRLRDAGGGAK